MKWEKGEAIWKQIQRHILKDISEGLYKPGEKLPTEKLLSERFGVNRHTVRNAIAALSEAGVTYVEQGRGTFVRESVLEYPLSQRTRFSQIVSGRHRLPDKTLLKSDTLKANSKIAKNLQLKIGDPIIRIEALSVADDIPLAHALNYLPAERFHGIEKIFKETKSLTESFKNFGIVDYTRKSTRIIAKIPSAVVANHLKQNKSKPILQTECVDVDSVGIPIEYGITSFSSDRVQLLVESKP